MRLKKFSVTRICLIVISVILISLLLSGCSVETSGEEKDYLLNTQWDQIDKYAKFCPDNSRTGCWSTAMAQIFYYHRMKPTGKVDYETTTGYKVREDLGSYEFDWNLFVEKLDDRTSEESIDEVAKYIYFISLVLEKDFDTGQYKTIKSEIKNKADYLNVNNAIIKLGSHLNCEVEDYHYSKEDLGIHSDEIEQLIKEEINSKRPIMMYFESGNQGHAAVIDGYSYFDGKFLVHINQGSGGVANKWYDFNKSVANHLDDMNHRVLLTIKPLENIIANAAKASYNDDYLLKTQWDIEGDYSKLYPVDKPVVFKPVSYWSTALAQILAYHQYQPTGEISYETGSGLKIIENLDSYKFDWDLFVERLDAKTSEVSIDQVAKYNYFTEVVLENNFGTDEYLTVIEDESNIEVSLAIDNLIKYYNCNANVYTYKLEEIKSSKDEIVGLIKTQIDNKCPVAFYYKPNSGDGSCVVIDGYSEENNKFFIHLNSGRDGWNNQWYEIDPLLEMKYLVLMTIR